MYPLPLHPHRHLYRFLLLTAFLLLLSMGLYLALSLQKEQQFQPASAASSVISLPEPTHAPPGFRLRVANGGVPDVSGAMTWHIQADSLGKSVEGFDVLVQFAGAPYEIVSVTAPADNLDILKFIKPSHLAITAIKKLGVQTDLVLYPEHDILRVVAKPLSDDKLSAHIVEVVGKETSKMIFNDVESPSGLTGVSAHAQE